MRRYLLYFLVFQTQMSCSGPGESKGGQDWIRLFDGKSLIGWKASEEPGTFSVENGTIKVAGPRSHLFYVGSVVNHDFKNFELKVDIMTRPGSNSGIYFHTRYQQVGFPVKGYEVQVNNSHVDWRRTGSLYAIQDISSSPATDNKWFTMHIVVKGKMILIKVNGKSVVRYTEPDNVIRKAGFKERLVSDGTFAIQGHDPKSVVFFKNIMVKPLPE